MNYEQQEISPFVTGLDSDRDPWRLPPDAFTDIDNFHLHHGYIEKRSGYTKFGQMVHSYAITAATSATEAVFTVASTALLLNGVTVTLSGFTATDWNTLNNQAYTVSDLTGTTFKLKDSGGTYVSSNGWAAYASGNGRVGYPTENRFSAITVASPGVFTPLFTTNISDGVQIKLSGFTQAGWADLNLRTFTVDNFGAGTFELLDEAGNSVDTSGYAAYNGLNGIMKFPNDYRIMGIYSYIHAANSPTLTASVGKRNLIFDTKRAAVYNTTSQQYQPIELTGKAAADFMSSSDTDHIWAADWQHSANTSNFYFTNGKPYTSASNIDGIFYYDALTPTIVTRLAPQINNATVSGQETWMNGCKFLFVARKRLIALYTYESSAPAAAAGGNSDAFPQRMRISKAGNPAVWDSVTPGNGKFADASTGEEIISARQIKDHIIVFFTNSVWVLKPTANPSNPYIWERLNSFRASDARMGSIDFDQYVLSLGQRGIFSSSIGRTERIDERIEDFADDKIHDANFGKVFGERQYDSNRSWFLYPEKDTSSTENNKALILDEESKGFSTYSIEMNVLGYGGTDRDLTAADITAANGYPDDNNPPGDAAAENFDDETAISFFFAEDEELMLGGDTSGTIFRMNNTNKDDGYPITCTLSTAQWNPYIKQGMKCQMGYIDIYFDADQDTFVTIETFTDKNPAPYTSTNTGIVSSTTVNLLPDLNYVDDVANITTLSPSTSGVTVTSYNHGLKVGDTIYFYHVNGMTEINDLELQVATTSLDSFTISVDASAFSAYTGGGEIYRYKFYPTKVWKRFYAGGYGLNHYIRLTESSGTSRIRIHSLKPAFRPRGRRVI